MACEAFSEKSPTAASGPMHNQNSIVGFAVSAPGRFTDGPVKQIESG